MCSSSYPSDFAVQVAYVGARPTHLEVNHNINILPAQYYNQGAAEVGVLNAAVANPMAGQIPQSTTLNAATMQQNLLYCLIPSLARSPRITHPLARRLTTRCRSRSPSR